MTKKLKFGLDFHGVINDAPEFFRDFADAAMGHGYEVYVISGGSTQKLEKYLNEWDIKYTGTFSLVDYFKKAGKIKFFDNGDFSVSDELWDTAKAKFCKKNKINLQIDDTIRYKQHFSTPFAFYDAKNKTCDLDGKIVDLSSPASRVLSEFEKILKSGSEITQVNRLNHKEHGRNNSYKNLR